MDCWQDFEADRPKSSEGYIPESPIAADTGGILYAMLQRATLALAADSLTDQTHAEGAQYSLRSTKISASLTAFLRIARELRAWLRPPARLTAASSG